MKNILKAMPLCAALLCPAAMAQDAVPAVEPTAAQPVAELAPVEVSNTKDPELKPYRTMWKSFAAFGTHHRLAPHADLRFILISQTDTAIKGLEMRLAGEETSTPVAVADDGTFTLPHSQIAFDDNAELLLNRKKNTVRWRPYIRSPHLPVGVQRLGDLRLECEIRWATEYDEIPFLTRNAVRLLGGPCHSARVRVLYPLPTQALSAVIRAGDRSENLMTESLGKDRNAFRPPLHDETWPDDALISFTFPPEPEVVKAHAP